MSCIILYYILSLCLHVLAMDLIHMKSNIVIFIIYIIVDRPVTRLMSSRSLFTYANSIN